MRNFLFTLGKSKKTWAFLAVALGAGGLGAYTPILSVGEHTASTHIEDYCDENPDTEACADIKED